MVPVLTVQKLEDLHLSQWLRKSRSWRNHHQGKSDKAGL